MTSGDKRHSSNGTPCRVVHVVQESGMGGLEVMLLRLLAGGFDLPPMDLFVLQKEGALQQQLAEHAAITYSTASAGGRWRCYSRALGVFRRLRGQIVHLHHTGPFSVILCRLAGCRAILYHIHGTSPGKSLPDVLKRRLLWPVAGRCCGAILANSETTKQTVIRRGLPKDKMVRLYNGIDFDYYKPGDDRGPVRRELGIDENAPLVTYIGRFTSGKDLSLWLDAAESVCSQRPTARFLMAGSGPEWARIRDLVDRKGLERQVILCGERSDVPRLLSASDLFLFLSRWETFGNAVVEALACGVPVLARDIPAMREILGGWPDMILKSTDRQQIADQVVQALTHPEEGKSRALAARQDLATRFGLRNMAHLLGGIYAAMAAQAGQGARA